MSTENPGSTIDRLIAESKQRQQQFEGKEPEQPPVPTPEPEPQPHEENDEEGEEVTVPAEPEVQPKEEPHEEQVHTEPATHTIDYKAFYDKVTAPLKARGKEYRFTDPDDVRSLVSQGVDYSYKTQQLSKDRTAVSLIRNANISDDDLRALIDVFKGSKEALIHFANVHGLVFSDFADVDEEEKKPYKPKTEAVTPEQQAFADALNSVQSDTAVGGIVWQFLNSLPQQDAERLFKHPNDISVLLDHAHKGIFQAVTGRMEQMIITKRLDVSSGYLPAYNTVLQLMTQEGAFLPPGQKPVQPTVITPPQPTLPEAERRNKVGATRTVPPQKRAPKKQGLTLAEIYKIKDPQRFLEEFQKFKEQNQ